MKKEDSKKTFYIKNTSIYLSSSIISAFISFITLPIYTRYLSPGDYGIIALFFMFGQVSTNFLSFGLQSASYRYYFKYKNNLDKYISLNSSILIYLILVYTLGSFIIYYTAPWLSKNLFANKISDTIIRWSFFSGCLEYLFIYFTYILTAQERSVQFSIIEISRSIIRAGITLYFMVISNLTYHAIIYATIITQCLVFIILVFLVIDLVKIQFSYYYFKKSFKFSYPMVLRLSIGLINQSFDKLMLTNFSGLSSVGYYSISEKFASLLKVIMDAVSKVWNPFFLKKAHENSDRSKKDIANKFKEISYLIISIGLIIMYFSEEAIKLFTTKDYYNAIYLTPIYILSILFSIMGMLSVPQIQFSEKTIFIIPSSLANLSINIVLNFLLIPKFGALGAIIALTISRSFSSITHFYFGQKLTPIPLERKKFIVMIFLLLIFIIPIYFIMFIQINFIAKILFKFFLITIYFILSYKMNLISENSFKKLIIKFKNK